MPSYQWSLSDSGMAMDMCPDCRALLASTHMRLGSHGATDAEPRALGAWSWLRASAARDGVSPGAGVRHHERGIAA